MTHRFKTYQQFRRFFVKCLTLRCKLYFDNLLSQRAYCGKMNFDHKNETLSISLVQPGEGNKTAFNDMRALSGGERSFSTVCFILSLWSIAESPFRCLDEFDVYMSVTSSGEKLKNWNSLPCFQTHSTPRDPVLEESASSRPAWISMLSIR
ncbi:Structural maintenance of chromosomes protein 6 [Saguinus oedipus]|uniref:Structural maintenance of chromosomes protein 6 n=1 Tax=Saguinus oedipus TaxID=9490 RepID=A0ABQ9U4Q2_SAGOE|nr:Structural maintenance of chromosomes protein 6 [Saguinus oedipus]